MHVPLEPQKGTRLLMSSMVKSVPMKLFWIWRGRGHGERHKREAGHMKIDAKTEAVLSQAKKHLEVARKGKRHFSLVPGPSDTLTWNL